MSERNMNMDYKDRLGIQECLNKDMTFKTIVKMIVKDATTVSKEVKSI